MQASLRITLITFFLGSILSIKAQNEWRGWGGAGLTLSLTKKLDLRLNHLRSYNLNSRVENGFNQSSMSLNYDLTKRISVLGGYMLTAFPSGSESTSRGYTRLSYRMPIAKLINWSNGLQAEYHSTTETRFRYRFIYITRLSNKKEIPFMHLTLSASYWLYYNLGGNEIRYFDKSGAVLTRHSPDGFHRGRLYLNVATKVVKGLTFTIYYMKQTEFNLFSSEFRKMNVVNPTTGKTSRSFDSYNVAGLGLLYDINLYSSKKTKGRSHSSTIKN
ncbi:MAG: DUF2490 domain-containing protein [Chitinophagaceae bacterium]